jgi:hypothetical protein
MAASIRAKLSSAAAYEGAGVLVGGHDDAQAGARVDVDVRVDTALADQAQPWQSFEQGRAHLGALPEKHQHFGVGQAFGQRVHVLDMVVPDRHFVAGQPGEAGQGAQRVKVVVEDRDLHGWPLGQAEQGTAAPARTARDDGAGAAGSSNLVPRIAVSKMNLLQE